jgi:hypothetical protein
MERKNPVNNTLERSRADNAPSTNHPRSTIIPTLQSIHLQLSPVHKTDVFIDQRPSKHEDAPAGKELQRQLT